MTAPLDLTAPSEPPRLLVVTLSNIGDVVLTTPVLEALASHFPNMPIDLVADARSAQLLGAAPYVGDIFLYNKRADWCQRLRFLHVLRRRRYQLVVDLRGPVFAQLVRAKRRLTKPHRRAPGLHAVEEHFAALAPLLPHRSPLRCRVYLSDEDQRAAGRLVAGLPGRRWLAIGPGANWPGKKWPREHYRVLLTLAAEHFDAAIILGSDQDLPDAQAIASNALPYVITTGSADLRTAAAVLSRAQAFVGNDSGLGHIAAALDVPTLTVFGPGDPVRYRPWGPQARIVQAPQNDLTQLSAERVWSALETLLDGQSEAL